VVYLTTLSVAQTIQRRMTGRLLNDGLERIWIEAVVVQFKIPFRYLPDGTEKNHKKFQ
jgi:hypothetical protein